MLENNLKGVVCKNRRPSVQECHGTKKCTRRFAGTITRPMFLYLQMKQHDLDFPTRENGKTIILFFFSFVLDCIVVVKLSLSCL